MKTQICQQSMKNHCENKNTGNYIGDSKIQQEITAGSPSICDNNLTKTQTGNYLYKIAKEHS